MKLLLPFFLIISLSFFSQSKKDLIYQLSLKEKELEEQQMIRLELEEKLAKTEKKLRYKKEQLRVVDKELNRLHEVVNNPFAEVDNHVRLCPKSIKDDSDALVEYFEEVAVTDIDKARAIYIWIIENIKYDDHSLNINQYQDQSIETVIKRKRGVCVGFSNLYTHFGKKMGLDIKDVSGFVKHNEFIANQNFENPIIQNNSGHQWNAIKIDGEWRIFDATWGQGNLRIDNKGKLQSIKKMNELWFNVCPYQSIYTHYPEDEDFLFIDVKVDLKEFSKLPYVDLCIFNMGMYDPREMLYYYLDNKEVDFPMIYKPHSLIKVIDAPTQRLLKLHDPIVFDIYAPKARNIYLHHGGRVMNFNPNLNKTSFGIKYTPTSMGDLKIMIEWQNSYHYLPLFEYEVK